jgi:hypothetical protein
LTNKALFYAAAASTFIAGVLHLAIVPMFFTQMSIDITIFFIVSGLTQIFWVIPVIKRWIKPWYYVGIGGTVILVIMYLIAVPGSGYPVSQLDIAIELFQIVFIILCSIIIAKNRGKMTLIAEKSLGRNGTIKLIVESKEGTAPLIKNIPIPYDTYTHQGKYCEVNDRKQRTDTEFKKEDNDEFQRQFLGSSIVTPSEFFEQAVPSFSEILKQKTLDDFIPKIADELSKVQRPRYQAEE